MDIMAIPRRPVARPGKTGARRPGLQPSATKPVSNEMLVPSVSLGMMPDTPVQTLDKDGKSSSATRAALAYRAAQVAVGTK